MLLVSIDGEEAILEVHFFNRIFFEGFISLASRGPPASCHLFPIKGGRRLPAGSEPGQVRVTAASDLDSQQPVLNLTVSPIGDYSTYTLAINPEDTRFSIDPLFGKIDFKFRPGCFRIDCAPEWEPAPPPQDNPAIDYLAKDYHSFKHTLIAAMEQRVPGWLPSSEADLDQVLIELFSAAADELSDYQDRVMNEAYLFTARKRVSLARHARLMDYHIHQGNQASTWLALEISGTASIGLPTGFMIWTGGETQVASSAVFMADRDHSFALDLEFKEILDQFDPSGGNLSEDLREVFAAHDIGLSPSARIEKRNERDEWAILDETEGKIYLIKKILNKLFVYSPHLYPLLNRLALYTWDGSIPSLAAGSSTADLQPLDASGLPLIDEISINEVRDLIRSGKVQHLLIQEWLNPATGLGAGSDPGKRQLLRLLSGVQGAESLRDPVAGAWFVRVRWREEDALRANYCFTVSCPDGKHENISLFHGNLIAVCHGWPLHAIFKDPDEPLLSEDELHYEMTDRGGTVCRLPQAPLSYRDTPLGGEVPPRSTLKVEVVSAGESDPWEEVISLVHSDGSAEGGDHFLVETDEAGMSLLRFGNDDNGRKLPEGAEVHCFCQLGHGLDGNIGAGALRYFDTSIYPEIQSVWNPFDVVNGRAPEPAADIIRRAPEAYRSRQLRAVTLQDYENRAQELPEVARAAARYAWTGSWRTVQVAVDPAGTAELSDELRDEVAGHLQAVGLIGEDLEIRGPSFVPLDIKVTLCVHQDYWTEDIRFILGQEFSEGYTPDGRRAFFHPDRWSFGQGLHSSQIIGRIQQIKGIDHVVSVTIKRWNEDAIGREEIAELRSNEIIRVRNDPDHMEDGFMTFVIGGGRK
ncbi:MAG: Baseplate J-like protein [Methanosaeta sp. PtaU1.Bin112]|nr:MAG: Baseplate J-like protein [Methanosaeta sp. PtaU1.Bin112]